MEHKFISKSRDYSEWNIEPSINIHPIANYDLRHNRPNKYGTVLFDERCKFNNRRIV